METFMKYIELKTFQDNAGFVFEELIQHLLIEEFGEEFKHTPLTNDGGKDFESKASSVLSNSKKIWAECKNYTSTLSYNDITKTLLMAYIKSVNKILVFSYSPVNRRFHSSIAEYKLKTGIDVEIYDDITLERYLLKYREKAWFSDYIDFKPAEEKDLLISPDIICQYTLSKKHRQNPVTKKIQINMHEMFSLNLVIVNKNMNSVNVHIDFADVNNYSCFEVLDDTLRKNGYVKNISISPCTSQLFHFNMRIVTFQDIYYLPKIKVNEQTYEIKKKLYTNWVAEVSLLRDSSHFNINDCLNYIDNNQKLSVICLEGTSGVGKSRFLLELHHEALRYDQQSFYFDIDKEEISLKLLCQELFSFFSKLPFFKQNKMYISTFLNTDKTNDVLKFAIQVLYNPNFDFKGEIDELAKYLFYYLKKTPTTILFDNVQRYDTSAVQLIDKLIVIASNQYCPSSIVLSFNTTYIFEFSYVNQLKNKLDLLSIEKTKRFCRIQLKGFNKEIAYEYIQKCFELDKNELHKFSTFINQIIEKAGINPLILQNYLIYLRRRNIVEIKNHQLLIKNPDYFYDEKASYSGDFGRIYSQLDTYFYSLCLADSDKNDYLQITGILSICKSLPEKVCIRLINTPQILEKLVNSGLFIYKSEDRTYFFKHNEAKKYYKNKYGLKYINKSDAVKILKSLPDKSKYIEQIFLLEMELDIIEKQTFDKILKKIQNYEIDFENTTEIFNAILDFLEYDTINNNPDKIIILSQITNYCTNYLGLKKSLDYYKKAFKIIKSHFDIYAVMLEQTLALFKEYLRHMMNSGLLKESQNLSLEMIGLKDQVPKAFQSIYQMELYKTKVLIDYKKGDITSAVKTLNDIKLMYPLKRNLKLHAECLMLEGSIYYKTSKRFAFRDIIAKSWIAGEAILGLQLRDYFQLSWDEKSLLLNVSIKRVLADLIILKTDDHLEIIEEMAKLLNQTGMVYFEVKIRHLLSIYYLLTGEHNSCEINKALSLAEETIEILCIQYGNKVLYATSLFIIAEIYKQKKDYNKMYQFFLNFYGIFSQIYYQEKQSDNEDYLLIEMALSIRKYKANISDTFNPNILKNITDTKLYEKIINIFYMDDIKFGKYFQVNNQQSLLYNKNTECNYPMI